MPLTTRAKRAATPATADAESAPPRKTRAKAGGGKVNADDGNGQLDTPEPEDLKKNSTDTTTTTATKQPRKTRAKTKVEPVADDENGDADEPEAKKPAPKKGRGKVKAEPADYDQGDAPEPEAKKPAPKKGRGKVKAEPADDDQAEDEAPKADGTEDSSASKPEVKEAQVAKAGTNIPLDEGCYMPGYHVYVDPNDGMIYDASLNQTNASGNNNKFYRLQVFIIEIPHLTGSQVLTGNTSSWRMTPTIRRGRAGVALESRDRTLPSEVVALMMP